MVSGPGSDVFLISSTIPLQADGNLDGIEGTLNIEAGAGINTLTVNDSSGTTNENVTLSANQITGFAGRSNDVTIFYSATDGSFDTPDQRDIFLLGSRAQANTFHIQGTPEESTAWIEGSSEDDVFQVSSDAPANQGNLDGIGGNLTIEAFEGTANRLVVSDF
ncbi:MAG: hypothetical protein ACFCD0_24205 [Gemmataceae bacterium]